MLAAGLALLFALGLTQTCAPSPRSTITSRCTSAPATRRRASAKCASIPTIPPWWDVAALPLLFVDVRFPADDLAWGTGRPWEVAGGSSTAGTTATGCSSGAAVLLCLAGALAALVFLWTRRSGGCGRGPGPPAGRPSPDVLAHGQIVTTDMGASLFIFVTVIAFERVTRRA